VIGSLTGIRAFAALWVVAHHLRLGPAYSFVLPMWLERLCGLGYLGVDLFGFLSGFVISYHYAARMAGADRQAVGRYLWVRAVRIVPLHWLALGLLVAARLGAVDFFAPPLYRQSDLVQQLLLVHGWGIGRFAWNLPSWTVSSEWLCYLLFPLTALALVRVRSGAACAALAAATLAATALAMVRVGHADFNAAMDWGVVRVFGEFTTGCWLERAWAAGFARRAPWPLVALAAVGAAVAFAVLPLAPAMVACFAVLVYALADQRGILSKLLSSRPLLFLGEASYAIYMMHWPVMRVLGRFVAPARTLAELRTVIALYLAAILAAALAVHLAFEDPVRRRLRGRFGPV